MELKDVASLINKITNGENLTTEEARDALISIVRNDESGIMQLSFLTALSSKGETLDELYGLCLANTILVPKIEAKADIDISGTGNAKIKTVNVSTIASFIVAAAGISVSKHTAFAVTSITGSADVLIELGIDLRKMQPLIVKQALEKTGIAPFFYLLFEGNPNWRALSTIREKYGTKWRGPYHLYANIFDPLNTKYRLYGCFDPKYLILLTRLMQKVKYRQGMAVYGEPGLCELSNCGATKIVEFKDDWVREYEVKPEDLGVKTSKVEDIKSVSREQNIIDFVRILYNKETGSKRDLVLINAGAGLYITGKAKTLKEGTQLAKQLLEEGKAANKLEQLEEWKKKAIH